MWALQHCKEKRKSENHTLKISVSSLVSLDTYILNECWFLWKYLVTLKYESMKLHLCFFEKKKKYLLLLNWSFCRLKKTGILLFYLKPITLYSWEHRWLHLRVHCNSSFLKMSPFQPFYRIYFRHWLNWLSLGLMSAEYDCFLPQFRLRKESIFT